MYYSKRNNEELEMLHPLVRSKMLIIMQEAEAQGLEILITDSLRTNAEQTKLYNQGRTTKGKVVTNAKAGYSFHNYGLAFDVVPVNADKTLSYGNYDVYKKFADIATKHGFVWGDTWKFKDTPHFEYTQGKPIIHFLNGGTLDQEDSKQFPEWAKEIVNHVQKNGVKTDLWSTVGVRPDGLPIYLFELLVIINKAKI